MTAVYCICPHTANDNLGRRVTAIVPRAIAALLFLFGLTICPQAKALDASDFSGLEGWTITAVTEVDGDFEGCDYDKKIRFTNGLVLTCSGYSYSYAYQPDAVILTKILSVGGRQYIEIKAIIEDEIYDFEPIIKK